MEPPVYLLAGGNAFHLPPDLPGGRWVVLGVRTGFEGVLRVETREQLRAEAPGVVFVLEPDQVAECGGLITPLAGMLGKGGRALVPLVKWKEPPTDRARNDGPVRSFAVTAELVDALGDVFDAGGIEDQLYEALRAVGTGRVRLDTLLVRQSPASQSTPFPLAGRCDPATVIVPHRGPKSDLAAALDLLSRAAGPGDPIRVGLDVDDPSEYAGLVAAFPGVEFVAVSPAPVGAYVIRQALVERAVEDLITFQDSDDLSCRDRFEILKRAVGRDGPDMVGSHELRVDELLGKVIAIRYPLDASAALAAGPGNPLLFPTGMITATAFRKAGGLSTVRPIASDTQFLFRAYFFIELANVDEFLYVRRRHAGSATTSAETGMGTSTRSALGKAWEADFREVRDGRLALADSTLAPERPTSEVSLRRLLPGRTAKV